MKAATPSTSVSIVLSFDRESSNYLQWIQCQIDELGPRFGRLAQVLKTHEKYVPPPIVESDFMPPVQLNEAGEVIDHGINAAGIKELKMAEILARNKQIRELKALEPSFYNAIWATQGVVSRERIASHTDYKKAYDDEDPNMLLAITRKTHHTEIARGGVKLIQRDLLNANKSFMAIVQKQNESAAQLKKRCEDEYTTLIGLGVAKKTQAELAMHYLYALDKRFEEYVMSTENDAVKGIDMPATMKDVYDQASAFKTKAVKISADGNLVSVFVTASEIKPMPSHVKARIIGGARSSPVPVKSAAAAATVPASEVISSDRRRCHLCKQTGHLIANCPNNRRRDPDHTLLAIGGEDDMDEFGMCDDAYLSTFVCNTCDTDTITLFTPTEIVLDNAAGGRGVFMNPNLVSDMATVRSYRMGGVNASAGGLVISAQGRYEDLGVVGFSPNAAANILSMARLKDMGIGVQYDGVKDQYTVKGPTRTYIFCRKFVEGAEFARPHYTYETADAEVLVTTVADNRRRYTAQEVARSERAEQLMTRLAFASNADAIAIVNQGILNCTTTATDLRIAQAINGIQLPSVRGKTKKRKSKAAANVIGRKIVQVEQSLHVDLMFIRDLIFLIGVFAPLGLAVVRLLSNKTALAVGAGLTSFLSIASSRWFDTVTIRTDGEGAVGKLKEELQAKHGLIVDTAGPGQHVPVVENMIKTVKERVRAHSTSLPFVMTKLLLAFCVLFCVSRLNLLPSATSLDKVSPTEQFTGIKLDYARDLRCGFCDYVQATVPDTNNSMSTRTLGCVTLLPTGNSTGSVKMWCLSTKTVLTRDQFRILPMPDLVCEYISRQAFLEGYTKRCFDVGIVPTSEEAVTDSPDPALPSMMHIDGREIPRAADIEAVSLELGVDVDDMPNLGVPLIALDAPEDVAAELGVPITAAAAAEAAADFSAPTHRASRERHAPKSLDDFVLVMNSEHDRIGFQIRKELAARSDWHDCDFAFVMSVKAAMRDRGPEAEAVILAELQQMVDKNVWHPVHTRGMSSKERRAIIRSSMFLKDKYLASGVFEKFKARLVAGGDMQDKNLYENLSSPTAATTSLLSVASIAAAESRHVMVIDIGGAFLNASMEPTGVLVHMRLNKIMATILLKIDQSYERFLENDGTLVVQLDKALYGCVEASALWFEDIKSKLVADGFVQNLYDACVFNKIGRSGKQTTVVMHVDDLFVTSKSISDLNEFDLYLKSMYNETKSNSARIVDFVGMTFDFTEKGSVKVTMDNCTEDILRDCGVDTIRTTPAASCLFDVRDAPKLSTEDSKYFHSYVAKVLYLAKRVRPECLTAVAFLSTRVQVCDIDDLAKLKRLLGYILGTRHRGIILCIGEHMTVKAYIDAAYGVHQDSGKSHTGCAIVLGDAGPVLAKSSKQKIVTKSSTESELVGLSDTATLAIHLRNFVIAQGYEIGPAVIYQDNLSCMALMKRGGPGSERSRHINIRHFWLAERVDGGEVIIEHLGTEKMFANLLTKPVQGIQFARERMGLTNWRQDQSGLA